jgi:hypothetical protein
MLAWKFFAAGAVAPFTGVRWPDKGWIESASGADQGVHACAVEHLPYWFDEELWEVELDGAISCHARQIVAARGRLVARIDEWPAAREDFTAACVERTRKRIDEALRRGRDGASFQGYLADVIRRRPYPGACAYIAARAAAATDGLPAHDEERAAQAGWLAAHLRLAHT